MKIELGCFTTDIPTKNYKKQQLALLTISSIGRLILIEWKQLDSYLFRFKQLLPSDIVHLESTSLRNIASSRETTITVQLLIIHMMLSCYAATLQTERSTISTHPDYSMFAHAD